MVAASAPHERSRTSKRDLMNAHAAIPEVHFFQDRLGDECSGAVEKESCCHDGT